MKQILQVSDFFKLQSEPEKIIFLIRFAIKAPSSHNSQPWLFKPGERSIELWGDKKRTLQISDPDNREFYISLGCALENLVTAADYFSLTPKVHILPDPAEPLLAARIELDFTKALPKEDDHLIFSISERHANRSPYTPQHIPEDLCRSIELLASSDTEVRLVKDSSTKEKVIEVFGSSTEVAFRNKGFTGELSHWIKSSLKKHRDGMPGYNIGVPWLASFIVPFAIRYKDLAKKQREMVELPARATPAFLVIATKEDAPETWIKAGVLAERIWLMVTRAGANMAAMAAPIEIGEGPKLLAAAIGTSYRPQIFARLGYATKMTPQSPRLSLEEVLIGESRHGPAELT